MQNQLEEAVKYFKETKGYERFFEGMLKKFESYQGGMSGTVVISAPTDEEKDALGKIMMRGYNRAKAIQIKIIAFQNKLKETKFSDVNVKDLVMAYFDLEIINKQTKKEMEAQKLETFFKSFVEKYEGTKAGNILKTIIDENSEEFSILKHEYTTNKQRLSISLNEACKGINYLSEEKVLLPVFATQVTKNPHAFDRKNLSGRLLVLLVAKFSNESRPKTVEEIAEFYYKHNLVIDELSNMVLCKNIIGMVGGKEHKGWLGFFENGEAMQVTLAQLANISSVKVHRNAALVVENPSVFAMLASRNGKMALVCTYGQLKLSGLVLLDMLAKAGVKLYYSGDIDPEGMLIADRLKSRYGKKIKLVDFDLKNYINHTSKVRLESHRIKKLENLNNPQLKELAKHVKEDGFASYEEDMIEELYKILEKYR